MSSAIPYRPSYAPILSRVLPPLVFGVLILAVWTMLTRGGLIPAYLFPSPEAVWEKIRSDFQSLARDIRITTIEAGLGFLIGGVFAFLAGCVFAHSRWLENLFHPYFVAMQAIPVVAIAPLLVIWFGSGMQGKIFLSAFISFFPVVVSTTLGLRQARAELLELMRLISASPIQTFLYVKLPSSLPMLFSGLRVSATLSVIGAIVAEIAGANAGLGHRILVASYRTDTPTMVAGILSAALVGLVFYGIVRASGAYLMRHHEQETSTT